MTYPTAVPPHLQPKLVLDPTITAAVEAHGWIIVRQDHDTVYYMKTRLQLSILYIREEYFAYIVPREKVSTADGSAVDPEEFVYRFKGRGAKAQARNAAIEMISEHFGYLAAVGVQLTSVSMELWSGSGRGGAYWEYAFNPRAMPEFENLFS